MLNVDLLEFSSFKKFSIMLMILLSIVIILNIVMSVFVIGLLMILIYISFAIVNALSLFFVIRDFVKNSKIKNI